MSSGGDLKTDCSSAGEEDTSGCTAGIISCAVASGGIGSGTALSAGSREGAVAATLVLLRRAGLPIVAIRTRGYCVGVDGSGETRRLTDECLLAGR